MGDSDVVTRGYVGCGCRRNRWASPCKIPSLSLPVCTGSLGLHARTSLEPTFFCLAALEVENVHQYLKRYYLCELCDTAHDDIVIDFDKL